MSYNEHFNYNNCSVCSTYTDTHQNYCAVSYTNTHQNYCATSYTNTHANYCATAYTNTHNNYCATSHANAYDNHNNWDNSGNCGTCSTSHNNYVNDCSVYHNNYVNDCTVSHYDYADQCAVSYDDAVDDCSTHANYVNHVNYTNPNTGGPTTLTWSSPWSGDTLSADKINSTEGVDAIKNLRDNLKFISENKGQQTASVDVDPSSPNVGDSEFNDASPATPEYVEDNQYDALRDSLNNLWSSIRGGAPIGVSDRAPGDEITKADWENMKKAADDLAEYDGSGTYANHANYSI